MTEKTDQRKVFIKFTLSAFTENSMEIDAWLLGLHGSVRQLFSLNNGAPGQHFLIPQPLTNPYLHQLLSFILQVIHPVFISEAVWHLNRFPWLRFKFSWMLGGRQRVLLIQLFGMHYNSANLLSKQVETVLEKVEKWRRGFVNKKMALSGICRMLSLKKMRPFFKNIDNL